MYKITKASNSISPIKEASFSEVGYKERDNLQERIGDTPDIFGEELLIIQKEFDGFSETRERLDLLALDKEGNLVVIENKLDDTGRDVVWQSLKYASYCSTLRRSEIVDIFQKYLGSSKNAIQELEQFFEVDDLEEVEFNKLQSQRVILVAGNFRKEVTSTVLWLMNYGLRVQCFKATIFVQGEEHFLNMEQIIPIQDAEEYTISMASKQQEEINYQSSKTKRDKIRFKFWEIFLNEIKTKSSLFLGVSPTERSWISVSTGMPGTLWSIVANNNYCRVELYTKDKEKEALFYELFELKDKIEKDFGDSLIREPLENRNATRISYRLEGVSVLQEENHKELIEFLTENMVKLYNTLDPYIQKIR